MKEHRGDKRDKNNKTNQPFNSKKHRSYWKNKAKRENKKNNINQKKIDKIIILSLVMLFVVCILILIL